MTTYCKEGCSPSLQCVVYCKDCDLNFCSNCSDKAHVNETSGHSLMDITPQRLSSTETLSSRSDIDIPLTSFISNEFQNIELEDSKDSFLLFDSSENLKVKNEEEFAKSLGCKKNESVKVISILGNTGDGKSHTLNHALFRGHEIFSTSDSQTSCTIGVWGAYNPELKVIALDTEGLLGIADNPNQRSRLLVKVLAISDIVIYRTRADRLHSDIFQFLGDASIAYTKYFHRELQTLSERCNLPTSNLGPSLLIFHETRYTDPLTAEPVKKNGIRIDMTPEMQIGERFQKQNRSHEAFSSLHYVGIRTSDETNFTPLKTIISDTLSNNTVRSPRSIHVIFMALKMMNDKFNGSINSATQNSLPEEYFTCASRCLSCKSKCVLSMNHIKDGLLHKSSSRCQYLEKFQNRVYLCKSCLHRGEEVIIIPKTAQSGDGIWLGLAKYAWKGYVMECSHCGVVYESRRHWYGNPNPEEAVCVEVRHVWPDSPQVFQGSHNAVRQLVDGLSDVSNSLATVTSGPTKLVSNWMADSIAPTYWMPNHLIKECHSCLIPLENEGKHHCRACGNGFCENCSDYWCPVPERGWGEEKNVKVCKPCYTQRTKQRNNDLPSESESVTARIVGQAITDTAKMFGTALQYPAGYMVDAVRPAYWVPDHEIKDCSVCKSEFGIRLAIHHCRSCGNGVCDPCSQHRRPVVVRGWDYPVRVCNHCEKTGNNLEL